MTTSIFDFTKYVIEEVEELLRVNASMIYQTDFERDVFVETVMAYIKLFRQRMESRKMDDAIEFILMCPWVAPIAENTLTVYEKDAKLFERFPDSCDLTEHNEQKRFMRFMFPIVRDDSFDINQLNLSSFPSFERSLSGTMVIAPKAMTVNNGGIVQTVRERDGVKITAFDFVDRFQVPEKWQASFVSITWGSMLEGAIDPYSLYIKWIGEHLFNSYKRVDVNAVDDVMQLYRLCFSIVAHRPQLSFFLSKHEHEKLKIVQAITSAELTKWINVASMHGVYAMPSLRESVRADIDYITVKSYHANSRIKSLIVHIIGKEKYAELEKKAKLIFMDVLSMIQPSDKGKIVSILKHEVKEEKVKARNSCSHYRNLHDLDGHSYHRGKQAYNAIIQQIAPLDNTPADEDVPMILICMDCGMPIECVHKLYEWEEKFTGKDTKAKMAGVIVERGVWNICKYCSTIIGSNDKHIVASGDPIEGTLTGIYEDTVLSTLREDAFDVLQRVTFKPQILIADFVKSIHTISKRTRALLYKKYASLAEFQRRNYLKLANRCLACAKVLHMIESEKGIHIGLEGVKRTDDKFNDMAKVVLDVEFTNKVLSLGLSEFDTVDKLVRKVPDMIRSFHTNVISEDLLHHWVIRRIDIRKHFEGSSAYLRALILAFRDLDIMIPVSEKNIDLTKLTEKEPTSANDDKTFPERQHRAVLPSYIVEPPDKSDLAVIIDAYHGDYLSYGCRRCTAMVDSTSPHLYIPRDNPASENEVIHAFCQGICNNAKLTGQTDFTKQLCGILDKNPDPERFNAAMAKEKGLLERLLNTYLSPMVSSNAVVEITVEKAQEQKKGEVDKAFATMIDRLLEFSDVIKKDLIAMFDSFGSTVSDEWKLMLYKSAFVSLRGYLNILSSPGKLSTTEDPLLVQFMAKMNALKRDLRFVTMHGKLTDTSMTDMTTANRLTVMRTDFYKAINEICMSESSAAFVIEFMVAQIANEQSCNVTEERIQTYKTFVEDRRQRKTMAYLASDFYEKLESGVAYMIGQEQEEFLQSTF